MKITIILLAYNLFSEFIDNHINIEINRHYEAARILNMPLSFFCFEVVLNSEVCM